MNLLRHGGTGQAAARQQKPWGQRIVPYLFIAPHLVFFVTFVATPVLYGFWLSLNQWDFLGEPKFVGLQNYLNLFDKSTVQGLYFWNAMGNTLEFVLYSVPLLVTIPLGLALALDTRLPGRVIFRTVFYAPMVLSVATVAIIWRWLLDTNAGLVNYYLKSILGIGEKIPWLADLPWAWISLVLMTVWWTIGGNLILFLAGLQDIPQTLYEAARIDGANSWQTFRYITLPGLKPTLLFVTVMTTIASFNLFGQPYMTTGGGPNRATQTAVMLIRDEAFKAYRMGSASAMAWVLGLLMMVVSIFQFRAMRQHIEY
ncbi:MAG TPA: sugar ABC transporter permease [Symbiobacteriaceae bacterium]